MKNPLYIVLGLLIIIAFGVLVFQGNSSTPTSSTPSTSGIAAQNSPATNPAPVVSAQKPAPAPALTGCAAQVAAAQASAKGKMCAQSFTKMSCPSPSSYVYLATNVCESGYLVGVSWRGINPTSGY